MTVHEIKRTSLMDVPAKLRELATHVENNKIKTVLVVLAHEGGYVSVRGFGERMSALECTGWLHRALTAMTEGANADLADGEYPPSPAS